MFDEKLLELLKCSNNIALFTHLRPDGDALGSAIALGLALEKEGKKVDYYCPSDINESFVFLPNIKKFNKRKIKEYDLTIALDCSDINRLSHTAEQFLSVKNTIKIDHHVSEDNFAKYNYVYHLPSTGEIIFYLLKELDFELTKDIATALYSAVSSDTGCFVHSNTTGDTHRIASCLIDCGADFNNANYWLFKFKNLGQLQLIKCAFDNLEFLENNEITFTFVTINDLKKCNISASESYILINNFTDIEGSKLTVVLTEDTPNFYFVSFRGLNIRCDKIAEAFGGGGHIPASGCKIRGNIEAIKNKIVKAYKENK